jgi:SAM-dependent methyltransferase
MDQFLSALSPRTFLKRDSLFRQYQYKFLQAHGATLRGRVVELGGERKYNHQRFFPHADPYLLTNVDRDFDVFLDATNMPFEDGSQANFVCVSVLEHIGDYPLAVDEMTRTLQPGGRLLLVLPFLFPIHDDVDYWRPSRSWFDRLDDAFHVDALVRLGGRLSSTANLLQRPPRRWTKRDVPMKAAGLALSLLGRFDQLDDSPMGFALVLRRR